MKILKSNVADVVGQFDSALGVFNKAKKKLNKAIETAKTVQQRKLDEAEKAREEANEIVNVATAKSSELRGKANQQEQDVTLLDKHILRMQSTLRNIDTLTGAV